MASTMKAAPSMEEGHRHVGQFEALDQIRYFSTWAQRPPALAVLLVHVAQPSAEVGADARRVGSSRGSTLSTSVCG